MSDEVFTYWEGTPYPFTQLCIDSISRIFGTRHQHVTPDTLPDWVHVPEALMECDHLLFRSDYIRTLLLREHGGWWFDCDVLLFRDPSELVGGVPKVWNLIYKVGGRWTPLINIGTLFTLARSPWICAIAAEFATVPAAGLPMTRQNEDIGQDIYERHSQPGSGVEVGSEYDFNSTYNVDADFAPFWDGRIDLHSAGYGLHIGASLSRWAAHEGSVTAEETLRAPSLDQLVERFPRSVVAQYLHRYGPP